MKRTELLSLSSFLFLLPWKASTCFVLNRNSALIRAPIAPNAKRLQRQPTSFVRVAVRDSGQFDASSEQPSSAINDVDSKDQKKKSLAVTIWVHFISLFIIVNYHHCWPAFLLEGVPLNQWSLVHAVSNMLFAGTIITTAILEALVVSDRTRQTMVFWFERVPLVEKKIVLPALTGSIVSGVAQAYEMYGSFGGAPRHIKSTLHLLALFGLWWGLTDRTTQGPALEHAKALSDDNIGDHDDLQLVPTASAYVQRRVSNIVSCLFLLVMYSIMVLKPGY